MSCEGSAIFSANVAYIPHIRQHHSTSLYSSTISNWHKETYFNWVTDIICTVTQFFKLKWIFLVQSFWRLLRPLKFGSSKFSNFWYKLSVFLQNTNIPSRSIRDIWNSKVEIFLEHREVAFLSPSKICENLNFSTEIQIFTNFAGW